MKKYLPLALAAVLALGATTAFAGESSNWTPCVNPGAGQAGQSNYESCMAAYRRAQQGNVYQQNEAMRHAYAAMETGIHQSGASASH